jgi:hypothetical protein
MGNMIAATVCSPIKEDNIAEIAVNPKAMFAVLFPVILIIPSAIRVSHPCQTQATANIRDPIIKKTASFINDLAILLAEPIPKYTSEIRMYNAMAGKGMGSVTININAVITMIIIRYPSRDKPSGVGRSMRIIPTIIVIKNHFFWVVKKENSLMIDVKTLTYRGGI